jgi:3-oxoacyl-[acyl-carrier-protein] synthase III
MARSRIEGARISAIVTCVPERVFSNLTDTTEFSKEDVRKVVGMAGVKNRRLAEEGVCSSDLCLAAAREALELSGWPQETVDALIMVTQTPDYFLPSTACIIQKELGLSDGCAAFDVGLGCSGYPYGLWLAGMMLGSGGFNRVLVLHGDTPSKYADRADRSVSLLFGDCGSATTVEGSDPGADGAWFFAHHTDGSGYRDMIIEAGGFRERFSEDVRKHFVKMNGANVFNFTIKRIPALVEETLSFSGAAKEDIDYFIFHQSNEFIIRHLAKKLGLELDRIPLTLGEFGNTGGPSIPLTITQGGLDRRKGRELRLMLLGYGVGLSWSSALVTLEAGVKLKHIELGAQSS